MIDNTIPLRIHKLMFLEKGLLGKTKNLVRNQVRNDITEKNKKIIDTGRSDVFMKGQKIREALL